ncbi:MAG: CheR family methyltransferase [Pseudomonadota bacterium]
MLKGLPDHLLRNLSRAIEEHLGLNYSEDRLADLQRAVTRASAGFGKSDPLSCLEWLLEPPHIADRIESLADFFTVGETYFFRDGKLFVAFEQEVLPGLIAKRREAGKKLRIWSAGCASGEEPYSLAIVVGRVLLDRAEWNVTILATDINQRSLRKCEEGVYGQWSFRDAPTGIKKAYFAKKQSGYEIVPEIRRMVRFGRLNLARDPFPDLVTDTHEMDVIFCRNVLMYFSRKRQEEIVERFNRCLSDDGWLVVSPAEASLVDLTKFEQVCIPGVVIFRKRRLQVVDMFHRPVELFEPPALEALFGRPEWIEIPRETVLADVPGDTYTSPAEPYPDSANGSEAEVDSFREGLERFREGKYSEAVFWLQQTLEQARIEGDDCAAAMSALAKAHANLGMLDQALEWCERACEADKLNPELHFLQATILEEMGDLERARVSLNRALFLDPNLVVARFAMGNLARRQGMLSVSNKHYGIALEVLAGYDVAEALPGSDNLTAGRLAEAIRATMVRETAYEQS